MGAGGKGTCAAAALLGAGLCVLPVVARPGFVQTLDGRRFTGEVQFGDNALTVDLTNAVALTNLQRLAFDLPGSPAPSARGRGRGLLGYYFTGTNFNGPPIVRLDEAIDFDWAESEPAPDVPRDQFSVVWCGELEAPVAGEFTFALGADDWARLHLDGKVAAESWQRTEGGEVATAPVMLRAGQRLPLRLEFFDGSGRAQVRLQWSGPDTPRGIVPKDRLHARSCLTNHMATLETSAGGLLGVYYGRPDFTGRTWARVDPAIDFNWAEMDPLPGFSRSAFGVRWSGQVLAEHGEPYTFAVLADEPARLWLGGRLLLATGADTFFFERRETVVLNAGERYDLRFETQSTGGQSSAKLMWSSPSTPKAVIPATHLFPSRPTRAALAEFADKTAPGVLLRNGTFIAGTVDSATETSLRLPARLKGKSISMVNVARVICQPMSDKLAARITPGRTGVLLARGDFVEAEFRGIERGQVNASSILFGTRSYDARKEAVAVVVRDAGLRAGLYEIRLADQTLLNAESFTLTAQVLALHDPLLGPLEFPVTDLAQIQRRP